MVVQYISTVEEDEIMISKQTLTIPRECSKLNVGDLVATKTAGDSAEILEVNVGVHYTKIKFGSHEVHSNAEFENEHLLYVIKKDTLN